MTGPDEAVPLSGEAKRGPSLPAAPWRGNSAPGAAARNEDDQVRIKGAIAGALIASGCGAGDVASDAPFESPRLAAMDAAILRGDYPETTGVLLLKDGDVVFETYYGAGGPDVLNDTWSVGKSVVSLATGAALADGLLPSLDARAFDYLQDLAPFAHDGPEKRAVTIRDLLTMSSPFDCLEMNPESPGAEPRMYESPDWIRWAADLPVEAGAAPGRWSYCTANVVLLARIIAGAAGESIEAYVGRRLFAPLGIDRSAWLSAPTGEPMGARVNLTARGYGALAQLILDRGATGDGEIVPADYVDAALTPAHTNVFNGQDYGYLFWRRDYATECGTVSVWRMSGFGGNAVAVLPERRAAVVVMRTRFQAPTMYAETFDLFEKHALPALMCG